MSGSSSFLCGTTIRTFFMALVPIDLQDRMMPPSIVSTSQARIP